ncbi:cysteine proteinase inhibitor 8 [Sorghum bicolor]|uniref:Cystatin domain-containing protein n=1 Tax=Sorghum bicolor TaxID=4558 RepID=C5WTN5_SORBI|nr:cysteine proteinase inhibitor 8 [Sorghum bicolor]EER95296.2 hypothetical protein SORBI_3001G461600 [Sorghum bicolor]|eukprot:XP_021308994.1 cysteine proteinase inhibitor 8 [Sorghum bicolor]
MRTSHLVVMAATAIFIAATTPAMASRARGGRAPPTPSPTQAEIGRLQGGFYQPIVNINDPHVQEVGRWAVSEHVKKANDGLKFSRVVSGQYQVVEGFNYRLIIDATDSHGKVAKYEAVVWEKEWENFLQLTSFKPAN